MQYGVSVWYSCLLVQHKAQLVMLVSISSKIAGQTLKPIFKAAHVKIMLSLAGKIWSDPTHILFEGHQSLPSNRKWTQS